MRAGALGPTSANTVPVSPGQKQRHRGKQGSRVPQTHIRRQAPSSVPYTPLFHVLLRTFSQDRCDHVIIQV